MSEEPVVAPPLATTPPFSIVDELIRQNGELIRQNAELVTRVLGPFVSTPATPASKPLLPEAPEAPVATVATVTIKTLDEGFDENDDGGCHASHAPSSVRAQIPSILRPQAQAQAQACPFIRDSFSCCPYTRYASMPDESPTTPGGQDAWYETVLNLIMLLLLVLMFVNFMSSFTASSFAMMP